MLFGIRIVLADANTNKHLHKTPLCKVQKREALVYIIVMVIVIKCSTVKPSVQGTIKIDRSKANLGISDRHLAEIRMCGGLAIG